MKFEPIKYWPSLPVVYAPLGKNGWTVRFAEPVKGQMPALDYICEVDSQCDPTFPVTKQQLRRLDGYFKHVAVQGPYGLQEEQLTIFKGEDAKDGMAEFRVGANMGHRILCFLRPNRTVVLACGFRKPAQGHTPPPMKVRARDVLADYERRSPRRNA